MGNFGVRSLCRGQAALAVMAHIKMSPRIMLVTAIWPVKICAVELCVLHSLSLHAALAMYFSAHDS